MIFRGALWYNRNVKERTDFFLRFDGDKMAQKTKKWEETIRLTAQAQETVSYADYFAQRSIFKSLQIQNKGAEEVNLTLLISSSSGLIRPLEKEVKVPFESAVEIDGKNLLSPLYFVSLEEAKEETISVRLQAQKTVVATAECKVLALSFDEWEGTGGNNETIAHFVRPKLADLARLKTETAEQLKKWGKESELSGYENTDKNLVRQTAAALFACLRRYSITQKAEDLSRPTTLSCGKILSGRVASEGEMALLFASALESMGLNPVIVLGERSIACGVWLYESCFMDTVSDDMGRLEKYIDDGINNLSVFDISDLFSGKNVAYSTSEHHFMQKLSDGKYFDRYVDIRRCRIGKLLPLPLRAKNIKGFEILDERETSPFSAPQNLQENKRLGLDGKLTKDKQWERRLLDLSLKNSLLHFQPNKGGVHLFSVDPDKTLENLTRSGKMTVRTGGQALISHLRNKADFNLVRELGQMKELIQIEQESGVLCALSSEEELQENMTRLVRKSKEANEESGSKILYLAFGFLKWYTREDGKEKYAPLVLLPVQLKKVKGGASFELSLTDEDASVNATLLEFLKREFDIDIRGLDGVSGLKINEILAMIRLEIVQMKGWAVFSDVYLSAFSFARYQMWQDLRKNIGEFSKNPLISSLLHNRNELGEGSLQAVQEDEGSLVDTLTPLPADSSQWEAISLSQRGASFVLHGPPGTGKSQTITNIIANALRDGKRVLFVAEKQAALSVVKKRLDAIGLGDFCLELHSNKTNKADVLGALSGTLSLAGKVENVSLREQSDGIEKAKEDLNAPLKALHKKRRLGVSVYEALLLCLKYKNAPEIMNIESSFYDSLTKEKIEYYKRIMVEAASAAKECGGVYNSPFSNVRLVEYSRGKRDGVYSSSEVMIAEIKHLKNYIALFLELYRQRISSITRKKLQTIKELVGLLVSGGFERYFGEDEEEFHVFFKANRQLDACLERYFSRYRRLVDVEKDLPQIGKWLDEGNGDVSSDKLAFSIAKKLAKASIVNVNEDEIVHDIALLREIFEAMQQAKNNTRLSRQFSAGKKVDFFEKRKAFLADLYRLHTLCASLFMDYNPDSFNSMCLRASSGYTAPVLEGLLRSLECFEAAENSFLAITNGDRNKVPEEDVLDYYTQKAGALIDNIDMLANWCMYRATAQKLDEAGLTFITDSLENGKVSGENIVASFEKNIYKNFLQTNIPLDPVLARFSVALQEEGTERLRLQLDEYAKKTAQNVRASLIARLPTPDSEGSLSLDLVNFNRFVKSNLRGVGIRKLFEEIPELMRVLAPCILMSPITVAQYLQADSNSFDLVIFDEASQMPTAEAVGSLARAKCAIVVGDPKQLPPTEFFSASYIDEENLENEDMESVLDDCLALGIPQKHLSWHYRSKHESLIAFSNLMYYGNKLCTFPSPDGIASKVKFIRVQDGVYDRGLTKRNKVEGDALVEEVIRRLRDPILQKASLGIVTFSSAQRDYIERKLTARILEERLEDVAYEREEALFIKNLENVQGDERDVILFSVCYGPDRNGKISLNFGPLNQAGGWRRLNVAVSRAREEMLVFSSMTGGMIDLSKSGAKGVAGLKAFLEFAEKGKTTLAIPAESVLEKKDGLGKYIAEELASYGYDCRYDVGVSDFKIDVAVLDPKNKQKFILAILCDGTEKFSVKDRNVLQIQTLKRNNWNVTRVFAVNYFNNPKREIKRIKDLLDKLTGADKKSGSCLARAKRNYKVAELEKRLESATFVTSGENDAEILARMKSVVATEEPISFRFLIKRVLASLGITKYGSKIEARMQALASLCAFKSEKIFGECYYRKTDKWNTFEKYRVETGEPLRKSPTDFTPYEIVALVKSALEDKVALYPDELLVIMANLFRLQKPSEEFALFVHDCITYGEEKGLLVRSVSDRISLA